MKRFAVAAALLICSNAWADEPAPGPTPPDATQPAATQPDPTPTPPAPPPVVTPDPTPAPKHKDVKDLNFTPAREAPRGVEDPMCAADMAERREEKLHPIADPRARPYFVKGELAAVTVVRPLTRRNFLGVSAGMSALPSGADTALNSFFFTVEPQVDFQFHELHNLKIGLGVPLQFRIVDTRAAFERCLGVARTAKDQGSDQTTIEAMTAACIMSEKDKATQDAGKLRKEDWDQPSDFAKVIRYITAGGEEQPFYLNISRLYGQTLGHGTVLRRYNSNLDYNVARVGATVDAYGGVFGFQSIVNDLVHPDVMGALAFARPLEAFFPSNTLLRSFSVGASVALGLDVPKTMGYEKGLFVPSVDAPVPLVNSDLVPQALTTETVQIYGVDAEVKLVRTPTSDLKLYVDAEQMANHGKGYTLGTLVRFSFGHPAAMALRLRAEVNYTDADYMPAFFDGFYDIFKRQYFPAGYRSSGAMSGNQLLYYPTKLGFLEANAGGPHRAGFYLEATHSFLNLLTTGIAFRGSMATGSASRAGFMGPAFDDLTECPWASGVLNCMGVPQRVVGDPGYADLMLHAEIPFKRFLQAFATYEIFSTSVNNQSVFKDLFQFDGDNEVLFSGVRLQILPILFLQAEARRFYFLQRLTNVDVANLKIEQDQNYHSEWTFALNLYAGLEF